MVPGISGLGKAASSGSKVAATAKTGAYLGNKTEILETKLAQHTESGNLDIQKKILETLIKSKRENGSDASDIQKYEKDLQTVILKIGQKGNSESGDSNGFKTYLKKEEQIEREVLSENEKNKPIRVKLEGIEGLSGFGRSDPFANPVNENDVTAKSVKGNQDEGLKLAESILPLAGPEGLAASAVLGMASKSKSDQEAAKAQKEAAQAQKKEALSKLTIEQRMGRYDINKRVTSFFTDVFKYIFLFIQTFVLSPLKLIFSIFIIFAIVTSILLGVMILSADKCSDDIKITEGASPVTNLYRQLLNPAYMRCAFWDNILLLWKPVQKLDVTNRVLTFMDQQIMSATGQYYFTRVEKNSDVKIGIFIDKLQLQESGYDVNLPTLIYATLKAVGGDFKGVHYCSLRGKTGTRIPNKEFKLTENIGEEIGCQFPAQEITEPGRDYEFRFVVLTDVSTYAYSNPFFIKRSTYDKIKKDEKELQKIKDRAGELLLKTTNAPMEIAGRIGTSGQNLIIVDDNGDSSQNVNKLEISFRKDWTTDDLSVIKKINKFAVILPPGIEMESGEGKFKDTYCGSFAFKKSDCSDLEKYFAAYYDKRICNTGDNVYKYDPSQENGEKLDNINQEKKIQCVIRYKDLNLLFKDSGVDSSIKMSNIQTMATYSFEITRIAQLKYTAKVPIATELQKYSCEDKTIALQKGVTTEISADTKKEYRKYQDTVKQFVSSEIPSGLSQEIFEAMIAAVMQKYSGNFIKTSENDLTGDGRIDYIAGCRLPLDEPLRSDLAEDYYEDIKCLVGSLASKYILASGDIKNTLDLYYKDSKEREAVYSGKTATADDVTIWTKAICYPTETPTSQATVS